MKYPETTFLTPAEVEHYTAFKSGALQCKNLAENSIIFHKDGNGKPKLTWHSVNNRPSLPKDEPLAHNDEPNFSAMD